MASPDTHHIDNQIITLFDQLCDAVSDAVGSSSEPGRYGLLSSLNVMLEQPRQAAERLRHPGTEQMTP